MDEFHINDRVVVVGKNSVGTIAFIGNTHFSNGLWLGIIFDHPIGRNNGSYEGIRYFKCSKNHGLFTRPCQVKKASFIPSESEVGKVSSGKNYPNYLRDDSLSKPNAKHNNYTRKTTPLKKVRKDITQKSTSTTIYSSGGFDYPDGNNPEVKPKSIIRTEKHLPKTQFSKQENGSKDSSSNKSSRTYACDHRDTISKVSNELIEVIDNIPSLGRKTQTLKQFSQQEEEAKDSSPDKGAKTQVNELRDMISKTSKDLNEVKDYVHSFDRKIVALKHLPEKQFSEEEEETKDITSDNGVKMHACEVKNTISKTSNELTKVKENILSTDRESWALKTFHEKQFSQLEKKGEESPIDEEATRRDFKFIDMISKTSKELNEVKDYVHNLDRKLKLLKISLREESSSSVKN